MCFEYVPITIQTKLLLTFSGGEVLEKRNFSHKSCFVLEETHAGMKIHFSSNFKEFELFCNFIW